MPNFVSRMGKWHAAKEIAVLPMDPEKGRMKPEIYEGPDRQAMVAITKNGNKPLGMDARQDMQMINLARQHGMTVDEYLAMHKEEIEEASRIQDELSAEPIKHEPAPKHEAVKSPKTGKYEGGFGELDDALAQGNK